MISLINHDFQWGRSEVVIIYPDHYGYLWILPADQTIKGLPHESSTGRVHLPEPRPKQI